MRHVGSDALQVVLTLLAQLILGLSLQQGVEAAHGDKRRSQVMGDGVDEEFQLLVLCCDFSQ